MILPRLKNTIKKIWALSYILVFLVPTVVSIFIYIQSTDMLQNEIIRANASLLKQIQFNIDGYLGSIEQVSLSIGLNPRVEKLLDMPSFADGNTRFESYLVSGELKRYVISVGIIDEIQIYSRKGDFLVTSGNILDSSTYYDIYYRSEKMGYDRFSKWLNTPHIREFSINNERNDNRKIVYAQSIPMFGNTYEGLVSILVSEDFFSQALENIDWMDKNSIYILDSSGKIISSTNNNFSEEQLKNIEMKGKSGISYLRQDDRDSVVSYNTSPNYGWKYMVITDTNIFWEKSNKIRNIAIISFFVAVLIGSLVTYVLVKKNYRPVFEIVSTLEQKRSIDCDKNHNEFHFIRDTVDNILDEYSRHMENFEQRKSIMKSAFLNKLIKGNLDNEIASDDYMSFFDVRFDYDNFGIMLFFIEESEELFQNDKKMNPSERGNLVNFILTNIMLELASRNNNAQMFEMDGMLALIINFRCDNPDENINEMLNIAQEGQQFILNNFKIYYSTGISSICTGISHLSNAYFEAFKALEYRLILGTNKVILYQDVPKSSKSDYYYPLEAEQRLINYMLTGDYLKSKAILDEIFCSNISVNKMSINLAKCLMFDVIGTIYKIISHLKNGKKSFQGPYKNSDFVEEILKYDTIEKMRIYMYSVLESICNYIESETGNDNNDMTERIEKFISAHYSDVNLSISTIADYIGLSADYVSRLFKDATGHGLLDYIARYRVEKAKKILMDSTININDIGLQVGFYSTATFIRTFKKYEGITPGEVKKLRAL